MNPLPRDKEPALETGGVYWLGPEAGVPFNFRSWYIRVVSCSTAGSTPEGMIWIEGYELTDRGDAVDRREVLAILNGVRRVDEVEVFPATAHWGRQLVRLVG